MILETVEICVYKIFPIYFSIHLVSTGQRDVRYYRYGIQFINMASHDVLFKWNENNIQRKQYVRPLSSAHFYGVLSVPKDRSSAPNLRIEAFNPATDERVLLNGDEYASFELFEKMRLRTVYVESDCKWLLMSIMISR